MLCDFHLHTNFSGDSQTPPDDQICRAIELGMKEICITDHHDYDTQGPGLDFMLDIPRYVPAIQNAAKKFAGRIRVNLGIELGLQQHVFEAVCDLPSQWPFDYVIGSSHFLDGTDPYDRTIFIGQEERVVYEHYFEVTLRRLQIYDCFDSFGHLDYIVRYGPNCNQYYDYARYREYIDPILKTLIEKGKALECNTSALKYGLGHPHPTEDILRRYRELGGELLTIGSDGHCPAHIGYAFDTLPQLLKNCGFRYYTIYHQRRPEFLPL
ncbi:MAG: histidinol-phosphatase HisJ family protein [Clostridiales bacterium]|nr:histidinol-phosphatase HisJ family protein [Clostridiales bacterium]